jgi:hypothetical protein
VEVDTYAKELLRKLSFVNPSLGMGLQFLLILKCALLEIQVKGIRLAVKGKVVLVLN